MRGGAVDPERPLVEPLTRREQEVLRLLAEGCTRPEIAERLTVTLSAVKFHVQNIYSKLGANSKSQAIQHASELGLLGDASPGAVPVNGRPVFQSALGQTTAAPAPESSRHNLPVQVTRFFGRENEIARLKDRLRNERLVTLTGPGGVGKTRLSLQAAEALLPEYSDRVWFVALAPLTDPALVAQTVATTLGLRDEPGRPVVETLLDHLRPRQVLLVLDNCEHLLVACAQLADSVLRACPRVKLLASSREPLGIEGEAVLAVPSLAFPAAGQAVAAERMGDYAAVRMFLDRVSLVVPEFAVTAANAGAVARICRRLDGIPLALEMAAARLNLLGAEQLADRLDDVFRLLTSGSRTALPRQQTLRATMDWSYELLGQPERSLLQRLSVFAGGCTLEAAEVVCADPPADGPEAGQAILAPVVGAEIVERLGGLVAKSMVLSLPQADQDVRYYLLETVRQYAREKLREAGETARLQTRHRDYFLGFAEKNIPKLETPAHAYWKAKLMAEADNFRQALEWSFSDPSAVEAGLRLLIAVGPRYWSAKAEIQRWLPRGLDWCERHPGIAGQLHVKLLQLAAWYYQLDDPSAGLALGLRAVAVSRGLGPEHTETLMWSLVGLAWNYMSDMGDADSAVAPQAEAGALLEALGPNYYAPPEALRVRALFEFHRGTLALHQRRYHAAKAHGAECLRLYELSGSRQFTRIGHSVLGDACFRLEEYQQAREHYLAIEKIDPASRDRDALTRLARVDAQLGEFDRALAYGRASIRVALQVPDRNHMASNLGLMAIVHALQGESARAALLSGASAAMWARQKRKPWEDSSLDTILPGWRDGPEQAAIQQAFDKGQAMNTDQAVAFALDEKTRP